MNLIIETDIGHDPDDFFAITYLLATGVDIKAILITPGDPDQIAIAKLICREVGKDIPIGVPVLGRSKLSSGSVHHEMLDRYGCSKMAVADGVGVDVIEKVVTEDTELFVVGPVTSVGRYLKSNVNRLNDLVTMQGGFAPYSLYKPAITVPSFEGKQSMPTFNLNGDRKGAEVFLNHPFKIRQMVGKNVCHSVLFDRSRLDTFIDPPNRAAELFMEAANLYLNKHESKKFHDPTAAVCHLHPEVGVWWAGKTVKAADGWTTVDGEDSILVDLDHEAMWEHLRTFS